MASMFKAAWKSVADKFYNFIIAFHNVGMLLFIVYIVLLASMANAMLAWVHCTVTDKPVPAIFSALWWLLRVSPSTVHSVSRPPEDNGEVDVERV